MTDAAPLDGPAAPPASGGPARRLILLLHGYGADGTDLIALAPVLAPLFPDAAFHAPHAPEPCEVMPFGRQWFSFTRHDPEMWRRDAANLEPALEMMTEGAASAAPSLNATIDSLMSRYGVGPASTALVGFSQGTMMALHVAVRRPAPLAAVVGFSGALTGAARLADEITARPPVTLVHGEADPVVPFPALAHAEAALRAAGVPVAAHGRPGLEHGIDEAGLEIAAAALEAAFAAADVQ
ncbi:alpha/beta hydrolase [Roseospira navarrensis]|uniref:Prolyl oligopeptidase family serine peptidase n=1 Tax=Roseospira navarrensis TaxID=140058 RepID=A0A7X2D3H4_9PROT|nr:dienelactone hydrolase family protein [Roseospira navarrensis]MQX35617.1 prolyl oligopeptidase family serine peptidase [Roseospira navarrensis]